MRQRRWMLGLSRAQAAERAGFRLDEFQQFESGDRPVDGTSLAAIAMALAVPVSYFEPRVACKAAILDKDEVTALIHSFRRITAEERRQLADLTGLVDWGKDTTPSGAEGSAA